MRRKNKLNYISLFAGCGGLSLGLFKAGWSGLFAIEKNEMAFETLKYNLIENNNHFDWPRWLPVKPLDINDVLRVYRRKLNKLQGRVTMVAGGPPCQGFSSAGRREEEDARNKLIDSYLDFVRIIEPRFVFFENVKGFTNKFVKRASSGRRYSEYVIEQLTDLDYNVKAEMINFTDFGIPQNRIRFILVGILDGSPKIFFNRLHENKIKFLKKSNLKENISVREAISDLERRHGKVKSPEFKNFMEGVYGNIETAYQEYMRQGNHVNGVTDSHRFANHKIDTVNKFKYMIEHCPKNRDVGDFARKRFNIRKNHIVVLEGNMQTPTLTSLPDDHIHYSEPRILTVREYARLQSFDDWFKFKGNYTTGGKRRRFDVPRYTQIGNAIPPLFMNQVGEVFKEFT